MIAPHGGKLINRELADKEKDEARKKVKSLPRLALAPFEVSDLEMIASGALSPLEGFMGQADFDSVLDKMRLFPLTHPSPLRGEGKGEGIVWTLPVVKSISAEERKSIREGQEAVLCDEKGETLAFLEIREIFPHDKTKHARQAYGTLEESHPGAARVMGMGEFLVAGKISLFQMPRYSDFLTYRLTPAQTRRAFEERGWKKIVAFQTRNPIHRAHEYIQKCALEIVDGLLIHPLVGATKGDDVPAEVRMRCYEVLIEKYYQKSRVLLSVFPAAMRYAGPREAIFHAIVRKNYGCTHFIVGRDHAGVSRPDGKGFYGSFDAQRIFDAFKPEEIGVTPLFFENSFYCRVCSAIVTEKICPHNSTDRVAFSGTQVREMLRRGEIPPPEFTRPEVARVLIEAYQVKEN